MAASNGGRDGRPSGAALRHGLSICFYVLVAACGYAAGVRGYFPFGESPAQAAKSLPLARVGIALRQEMPQATPEAWDALRGDVEAVRRAWKAPEPAAFDLVVALRGLDNRGNTNWIRAEELCRELKWPRCDRAALEELKRRSRP